MAPNIVAADIDGGRIAENILYFARLLRAAGLPVGPRQVTEATEAVMAAGLESPHALYWSLHAVFVNRRPERDIFNQAFLLFWKDPDYLQQLLSVMLPTRQIESERGDKNALARRLNEALMPPASTPEREEQDQLELDASETWSDREALREKDFAQMTADELRRARAALVHMPLLMEEIRTRRFSAAARRERLDVRAVMREMAAKGSDHLRPRYKGRTSRRPPLVVLCDISGSMDSYARVFLHFLYAVTNDRDRVHAFVFGTRLTNVTRTLKGRDPDVAIAKAATKVEDWSGGTRIGHCLEVFNREWARRVLGQNATVLLFTDGLDREGGEGMRRALRRLSASCRRLVWVNPLLRYDGYEPAASGARALDRHVDESRACHNLASLEDLAEALGGSRRR